MARAALAVLSTENLLHNLKTIKLLAPSSKIIAMVKANAYGHGLRSVSMRLDGHADMLGVASIDEAMELRKIGIKTPIMLSEGAFESSELLLASIHGFHVVFCHDLQIEWLEKQDIPVPINAWIKINTGMGRIGFPVDGADTAYQLLHNSLKTKKPVRIMSHFACADDKNHSLNQLQISRFKDFIKDKNSEYSIANSAAIINFKDSLYDYVRPGIALYGVSPIREISAEKIGLRPVMTLQSKIISIQNMKKGDYIGYGALYQCECDMLVGVIAFGYGDGYPISASGASVMINGVECEVVGRVSMDMITVDLRAVPNAKIGDAVVLVGEGVSLSRLAEHSNSIPWEIMTSIQGRVKFLWTRCD